jgi:hypothetical protein
MHIATLAQDLIRSNCSLQVIYCVLMISKFQDFLYSVNRTIFHCQVMTFDVVAIMIYGMNV